MKILFYSYAYPNPVHPGVGTFNRTMIAGLACDHQLQVVTPVPFVDAWQARLQGRLPRGLNDPNFHAVPGVPARYVASYYTPKMLHAQYGRFMSWSVGRPLNRIMKEFRPDLVLSYWAHPDGEVAVRTAHRHGVPAVVMIGGSDVLVLGRSGSRRRKILDVLQNADGIVTVSEHIADTLIGDGVPSRKIRVVRRGVDRTAFSPGDQALARQGLGLSPTTPLLLTVGRLVPVKGHCDLLQACRLLAARRVKFQCHILGDGPLGPALQKQITQLGLDGTVHLVGGQPQNQLAEWYRAADVTVLPSLSEGVPNVLMESIACGTPIVATDVGGIPEIADPHRDRLVPVSSPVALADAIEWQLKVRRNPPPARAFEPLALKAAARRLSGVLQNVVETVKTPSRRWYAFGQPTPTDQVVEAACNVQNSLPAASTALTEPVLSVADESVENPHWNDSLCLPTTNLFANELGRTGEEFVLPRNIP